eukprot:1161585-Pelagomonas_calceolata.AAC.16
MALKNSFHRAAGRASKETGIGAPQPHPGTHNHPHPPVAESPFKRMPGRCPRYIRTRGGQSAAPGRPAPTLAPPAATRP